MRCPWAKGDDAFLYDSTNNGLDSFTNSAGADTIYGTEDNTTIGLNGLGAVGFRNGVDVIDDGDHAGVRVVGTTSHDKLDLSGVTYASDLLIESNFGNDIVATALDHTGDVVNYDGGPSTDTLVISGNSSSRARLLT